MKAIHHIYQTESITSIFLFYDLRPEAQVLLNISTAATVQFTLLEDGTALYHSDKVTPDSLVHKFLNKWRFGWRWQHAAHVGMHSKLQSIHCFYPNCLRDDLKTKNISVLPLLHVSERQHINKQLNRDYNSDNQPYCLIMVPHSVSVNKEIFSYFIKKAITYADKKKLKPLFKTHPRDDDPELLADNGTLDYCFAPKEIPAELLCFLYPNIMSAIGFRTSSLHIMKALFPTIEFLYFEHKDLDNTLFWANFYHSIGIKGL